MLKIFGSGKLKNLGQLKIYNNSSYFTTASYGTFTVQFGIIKNANDSSLPLGMIPTTVAGVPTGIYISNPQDGRNRNFNSGSFIIKPWAFLTSVGALNTNYNSTPTFYDGDLMYLSSTTAIVTQSDGKYIMGYERYFDQAVQRLNTVTLDADSSFIVKTGSGADNAGGAYAIAVQPYDQKILVGGISTRYSGSVVEKLFRINPNGTLDPDFKTGSGINQGSTAFYPLDIKVQNDKKILVVGNFTNYSASYVSSGSMRLTASGSVDPDFKTNGGFSGSAAVPTYTCYSVSLHPTDGTILMGGAFSNYSGSQVSKLVRTNASGAIDSTFKTGSGFSSTAIVYKVLHTSIAAAPILVGGSFASYSGSSVGGFMALNSDGSISTTFKTGGGFSGSSATVKNIVVDNSTSPRIYVYGDFTDYSGSSGAPYQSGIVRLNSNGSVDTAFDPSFFYSINPSVIDQQAKIKKDSSGKYVVVGVFEGINSKLAKSSYSSLIFRYNSDFSFDSTFNPGYGFVNPLFSTPYDFNFQSDNKIVAVGPFSTYSGSYYNNYTRTNGIIRINTDGTIDNTYKTGSGFGTNLFIANPKAIAMQSDDKAVVVGTFTSYSGSNTNRIVRINTDGSKDQTFITGSGLNNDGTEVKVFTNGKIYVGGDFTSYSGSSINRIARINSDGTLDTTFSVGTGFNNTVRTITSQSDGKIMVGGAFSQYNGVTVGGIVRLNNDGTQDTSFNNGGSGFSNNSANPVVKILQKQDLGYVVLIFRNYGGTCKYNSTTDVYQMVTLKNDGSFNSTTSLSGDSSTYAAEVVELSDGSLVVTGQFDLVSGSAQCNIAQLSPDGSTTYKIYQ